MSFISVAIDGPSGAGKSTIARAASQRLGYTYVDTGAMYRAIGLAVCRQGVSENDVPGIIRVLPTIDISLRYEASGQRVLLCGEDVSDQIRTPQIAQYASKVSAVPEVRHFLLDLQRDMAKHGNVIMDGRDIGTVVLPNADVKVFLTASGICRAKRRHKELLEKGETISLQQVQQDIERRDLQDRSRATAPLKQADDAILLDNSELSFEQTLDALLKIIKEKK